MYRRNERVPNGDHNDLRVHQALGGIACPTKEKPEQVDYEKKGYCLENRNGKWDAMHAFEDQVSKKRDRHRGQETGAGKYSEIQWLIFQRAGRHQIARPALGSIFFFCESRDNVAREVATFRPRSRSKGTFSGVKQTGAWYFWLSYRTSVGRYFTSFASHPESSLVLDEMATEEEYVVLAEDQRVFGAGIKRKRVQFVPAAAVDVSQTALQPTTTRNAGDRYLSIVLPKEAKPSLDTADILESTADRAQAASQTTDIPNDGICDICKLPLNPDSTSSLQPHESSLVHQFCLEHSYPPSHLDRNRPGLRYLASYGYDPDSRLGLGARGEGIRAPLKGKVKHDTVGLGVELAKGKGLVGEAKAVKRLDAKGVRKKEAEDKKRREKLQEMFYGNGELEKYLGPNSY